MDTNVENDFPPSPTNNSTEYEDIADLQPPNEVPDEVPDEVLDEELDELPEEEPDELPEEEPDELPEEEPESHVSLLLKRLQASGALLQKPKQEFVCKTCDEYFVDWDDLEQHLIQHVSLPSIILDKLPSDDEVENSEDEQWSDEEDAPKTEKENSAKTPTKIDVSELLKQKGIQIKRPAEKKPENSSAALNKLSGLGFTIKKNSTPIKEEKPESDKESNNDLMKKLGNLGSIKLKIKSDGNNTNTFKVINGLKDFKTSDDEDEGSGNDDKDDEGSEQENNGESEKEHSSGEEQNESAGRKDSDSDDDSQDKIPLAQRMGKEKKTVLKKKAAKHSKLVKPKEEPESEPQAAPTAPAKRPAIKQTPKRGANVSVGKQIKQAQPPKPATSPQSEITTTTKTEKLDKTETPSKTETPAKTETPPKTETPAKTETPVQEAVENVVIKKEKESDPPAQTSENDLPLFSGQIKTERSSPPAETISTPMISQVKSETDPVPASTDSQPLFSNTSQTTPAKTVPVPLLAVPKTEVITSVIEINGDSDGDDDCCVVVSSTPAPDVKPVIPKTENVSTYPTASPYAPTQTTYAAPVSEVRSASTEKQHSFNWNAPDTKPPIDMLERSADDIFESLLSSTKKEGGSLSDINEYISLDRLGSQHTCDVCNTRFTDSLMLDDHIRTTGHSKSIIMPSMSSSSLQPYNPSSALMSQLLPVKQLADQVGKLSAMGSVGSSAGYQQNVMINIQAYPGAGGMMPPQSPYNAYAPPQSMPPSYQQTQNNMPYGTPGQTMPGTYPGQYMGQQYGQQYQPQMGKSPSYPGMQSPYSNVSVSSPYSTASPLQSMQQAVYGQAPGMASTQAHMGQMGPPSMPSPSQYAASAGSSGAMKPPSAGGIRIQNVQTFQPGQLVGANGQPIQPGQVATAQSPGQVRVAGPNLTGTRPRMPTTVRGARPSIRPGIQVQGQVRGARPGGPRMLKRPGPMQGGPQQKRRPDMLLPGKHDNEDCHVMAMQKQRDGLPMIHSVQGAKDKLNLGNQISITKKPVNREANAMANVLASRGISIKQKQKSRSPSPERPVPHIPNLPAGMSIKATSKSSNFSIPEATVGSGGYSCKICNKMFMSSSSVAVHMMNAHPQSKVPLFKCDECPASYPKSLQLQHHKRTFHNVTGPNRELGLPVVDLSQHENIQKLSNLGIYSFIPLASRENANGSFGIPVISVHNMQNGLTSSLSALGADGLLSLGPLKSLPNT